MGKGLKIIGELRKTVGNVLQETKSNSTSALQREIKKELGNADKVLSEKMYPPADSFKKEGIERDFLREYYELSGKMYAERELIVHP